MTTAFYLTNTPRPDGDWYMLFLQDYHFCLSSGNDLGVILEVLKSYVKKYRTKDRLLRAMNNLGYGMDVSTPTFEQREDYYSEHGKDYDALVREVVSTTLSEARKEDRLNSPLRKTKSRLKKAGGVKSSVVENPVKKSSSPKKSSAKKTIHARRPLVLTGK